MGSNIAPAQPLPTSSFRRGINDRSWRHPADRRSRAAGAIADLGGGRLGVESGLLDSPSGPFRAAGDEPPAHPSPAWRCPGCRMPRQRRQRRCGVDASIVKRGAFPEGSLISGMKLRGLGTKGPASELRRASSSIPALISAAPDIPPRRHSVIGDRTGALRCPLIRFPLTLQRLARPSLGAAAAPPTGSRRSVGSSRRQPPKGAHR